MRVLFNLLDAGIGGGQRVALEVARRLMADGETLGLLVPGAGPAADEFRSLGADVHLADLQTLRRMSGVGPAALFGQRFDVVYSHTSVPGEILGSRVARRANIAHVVHRHTDPHLSPNPSTRFVQRRLYRRDLRMTPFIAVAAHVAARLEGLGIPRERIVVLANGVDADAVRARAGTVEPRGTGLAVGVLGRFDPSRGLDVFVGSLRRVRTPGVTFVIGGAPGPFLDHESAVRGAAARAGVVIEEPGPAGVEFLASLDVVVMPSRYEGSPLTLFEAMALARPVVASRIPGIAEVLEPNDAGVLVPPDDPDALARAIASLCADPARRAALGRRALETVRRDHDLEQVLDRIGEILRVAAAGR